MSHYNWDHFKTGVVDFIAPEEVIEAFLKEN